MPERSQYRVGSRLLTERKDHKAPNGDKYDIRFIAATEQLASDGGIIPMSAWRLDRFKTNPRFISNHDLHGWMGGITDTVVGTVVDIRTEEDLPEDMAPGGKGLVAYVRFANTEFAKEMRTLYMDGDLDAVSVQWDWRTHKDRSPTDEEIEEHGVKLNWVATRADLLELSSVIVGADPGALALRGRIGDAVALCRSKGIVLPKIDALLEREPFLARTEDKPPPATLDGLEDATQVDDPALLPLLRAVDDGALADAIAALRRTLEAWDLWSLQGFEVREGLGNVANAFSALIAGDEIGEVIDVDERSLADIIVRIREMTSLEDLQGAFAEFQDAFSQQLASVAGDDQVDLSDADDDKISEIVAGDDDVDIDDVYDREEVEGDAKAEDAEEGDKAGDGKAEDAEGDLEARDPDEKPAAEDADNQEVGEESVYLKLIFGSEEEEGAVKAA